MTSKDIQNGIRSEHLSIQVDEKERILVDETKQGRRLIRLVYTSEID